ncbi:MAG: bifunctional phosphopantothenoylcysteine decarboxylase/phosphopantothenate--cysteine ligase CoaBC [Candidatus Kapaibacteriales bacterium]
MNILENKRIIVGITGSIAAYKSLFLVRELMKLNSVVLPVMTPSAKNFITPLSLTNLAKNSVVIDMFDIQSQQSGAWHIHFANSADLMIIAPCTATTIGKIANGVCDNSLVTIATALPKNIPMLIAPAMDTTMWLHPTTQRNIQTLANYGYKIIPPVAGELASGFYGEGRLPEIPTLLDYIEISLWVKHLENLQIESHLNKLLGKRVLITAGPTFEKIDDVRFIGNFSTGKMGYALAKVVNYFGGKVTLVSGPSSLSKPDIDNFYKVQSSDEMFEIVASNAPNMDIIIMASAVADFKPKTKVQGKIKKDTISNGLTIEFEPTKDILNYLGQNKTKNQILIGFALEETKFALENAKNKLIDKNCDFLVLNYLDKEKSGFETDFNTIVILKKTNHFEILEFEPYPKNFCAILILNELCKTF